jgi:membrane-associated protease RseP (regulator of RpoE activity)
LEQEEQHKRFEFIYGLIMLRTTRINSLMDRMGRYRITRPLGWFLLYLLPIAAGIGLFIFLLNFELFFSSQVHNVGTAVRSISPLAYLGLPGINPYIPLLDGWAALIVAMIIHEGAHGVVARSLGYPVKTAGLLFFLVIPIGAFVEVDEKALKAGRARDTGRILAAGAGVNFVAGIVFLLLLSNVVSTMTPAANGVAIEQVNVGSPAAAVGIKPGDFLVKVDGIHYNDPSNLGTASWYRPGQVINLTIYRGGETIQIPSLTVGSNPDNASRAYLGISSVSASYLQGIVSTYSGAFLSRPITYFCIPAFPRCQDIAPFSDQLSVFYSSSYGSSLVPLANFLYWMFFLNLNLAIFNAMPIYPLDGGQAFEAGLKGLVRGKVSEKTVFRITSGITFVMLFIVASLPLAAYLNLI